MHLILCPILMAISKYFSLLYERRAEVPLHSRFSVTDRKSNDVLYTFATNIQLPIKLKISNQVKQLYHFLNMLYMSSFMC